jgi:PAT family beta-lactamase induction signal transducer AmpG
MMAIKIYLTPRMLLLLWLGLVSGVPLALTASTLTAWLTENGIDIKTIGIFALVGIPYTFKFAFAPLMDGLSPPLLGKLFGRRRSWMLVWVALLAFFCFLISHTSPNLQPWLVAWLTLLLAFASASFDINLDALRIEMLPTEEQGAGAAMAVLGYRIGMIISSAGALYIAEYMSWSAAYATMAMVLALGIIPVLLVSNTQSNSQNSTTSERSDLEKWLRTYMVEPFINFAQTRGWWLVLLFIILFKLGDACLGFMTTPFLLEVGYTKAEIASVVKLFGLLSSIFGGLIGGWIVMRLGVLRSLYVGGILQALANLPYAYLAALNGTDTQALAITISVDNFCGGIATTAFVAYISSLCNLRFTATQYALLNSLASIGRIFFTTSSGVIAASLGWPWFFVLTTLMGLPGLVLLYVLQVFYKRKNDSINTL